MPVQNRLNLLRIDTSGSESKHSGENREETNEVTETVDKYDIMIDELSPLHTIDRD